MKKFLVILLGAGIVLLASCHNGNSSANTSDTSLIHDSSMSATPNSSMPPLDTTLRDTLSKKTDSLQR